MTVTPTTIKARYTEFSSIGDATVQVYLDDATLELNESQWGDLYDRGLSALTAHLLAIANRNAASSGMGVSIGGALTSRAVGSVSVSFSTASSTSSVEDFYLSTVYGADYWRLCKVVGLGMVAVN